jgi:secreted trypsin-like serine protease
MRRTSIILVAACILASKLANVSYGVVGGTPEMGALYNRTGALVIRPFGSPVLVCTATIIAPHVLITAAHCVLAWSAQSLEFTLRADVSGADELNSVFVRRAYVNPAYNRQAGSSPPDIALIEFDSPFTDGTVEYMLNPVTAASALRPGARIELVGYGRTEPSGRLGRRNAAEAAITSVDVDEMTVGRLGETQNCDGDSGGSAFLLHSDGTRLLASIVSRSARDTTDCVDGSIHVRIDAYSDWIAATIRSIEEGLQHERQGKTGLDITQHEFRVITFKPK